MKRFFFYLFVAIFLTTTFLQSTPRAQANPLVLAAPEVAVGMLELMMVASAAAAAAGTITAAQNEEYRHELQKKIDAIQDAVKRGLKASVKAVEQAVAVIVLANQELHAIPGACLKRIAGGGSSTKTHEARVATEGECRPELRGDPYKCCPQFMKKFGKNEMTSVGPSAFKVLYYGRHSITNSCCFEWDSLHGRFEVYTSSNHQDFKHMGEKACARDEDLDDDVCKSTFPDKADFLSRRHAPRNGCQ